MTALFSGEWIVYKKHGDRAVYMCPFGQHPKGIHIITVGTEQHCLHAMVMRGAAIVKQPPKESLL